ncbi:venom dipeptidyl peptidase 4-like [Schistocerca cancellata]|uniref:venom dipeptidyl peptidase 4-like n=1 Tax=Schistocerca cancellata TaxID=274614 RepID=UPI0021175D10|nr:venom dipeptidyl peptidase 4-like [Schistocerca cancellata]
MVQGFSAVVLLATAATCVVLLPIATVATKEPFGLDDILYGDFTPESFTAKWISASVLLFEYEDEVRAWDVSTDETYDVVPKEVFAEYKPLKPKLSSNWKYVLFGYDAQWIFQHAGSARYLAYTMSKNTTIEIGGGERLQAAVWGEEQSQLAYVYRNNIYYLPEPGAEPIQITTDGVPDVIFNGVYDIYSGASSSPEATLGNDAALEFSPDGTKLIYIQYDVTLVDNASFILEYGSPGSLKHQYATPVTFRYQKVGRTKPREYLKLVTLPSENSTSVTTQELVPPVDVVGEDYYIQESVWMDENTLMVWFSNRLENITQFVTYNTRSKSAQITGEKGLKLEQKGGWLDQQTVLYRYGSPSSFLTIAWQPQGDAGSFPHVVKVTGNSIKAITSGELTVTDLYAWYGNGTVYYQATEEGQPSRRQVYAVDEGGEPRCLSCRLKSPEKNPCLRASASFSADLSWFTIECSGPDPPVVTIHSTADNRRISRREHSNTALRKRLSHKLLPQQLDDWVELEGGLRAQVRLLLPPDLDPEGDEKRPALLYVYAGPGHQQVDDSFDVDLPSYFTTTRRYVVILIDGRGSACHGDRMLFSVYRRLGTAEVEDQIIVTKKLLQKYPFIDRSRIGVWGWSYGGYTAAMVLARDDKNIFKCGVSVAPVISWIYTDSLYTEAYMSYPTPDDNEAGYNESDVTRLAARFAKKKFLLVHGTADDVVFHQNSAMLARALEEAGVLFKEQIYPDEYHWLLSRKHHLYSTMDQFFRECFDRSYLLIDILREMVASQHQ